MEYALEVLKTIMKSYTRNTLYLKPKTRVIYDAILTSAKGECPFCGGLGDPSNLDHFYLKRSFLNLVFILQI